ncbi:uncharacterized protein [Coffea arabica]|uniref:Reverse transcriptase zinc-binding domain-containing protein n=1 Tax=Coffea arabica TaxID=13443 RepID=A0ABM4WQ16_COFAR
MKAKYLAQPQNWDRDTPIAASWTWKSIFGTRLLVKRGTGKRVGNGQTVDIWKDNWIHGTEEGRIKTQRDPNCTLGKVEELIADGEWNHEVLNRWFIAEDVQRIKAIPLSITGCQDRLYWRYTKSGVFTVKSAYDVAMETRQYQHMNRLRRDSGSTSYDQQNSRSGKKRTGKGSPMCRSCGEEVETLEHMFFFCDTAETTWKLAPLQWDGLKEMRGNFVKWWEGMLGAKKREQGQEHIALTVNILWQIWKARNRKAFEEKEADPRKTVQKAIVEWDEYTETQKDIAGEFIQQTTNSCKAEKWRPPPNNSIRINSDAAFSQNMERT